MNSTPDILAEAKELLIEMKDRIDRTAVTPEVFKFYAHRYTEMKEKVDRLAAELRQRQDKIHFINDLICDINNLTDENNAIDLSENITIQEKLRVAKELGVNISSDKLKYSPIERDRLIQNIQMKADEWDKENRTQFQKVEIHVKELDRIMMMIKEVQKSEDRPKRSATAGIKGS